MRILYNYPSRGRPERFIEGLKNIVYMSADKDDYRIWCVLDSDDPSINEYESLLVKSGVHYEKNSYFSLGKSKSKVDAINRKLPDLSWDILVNFSDDMRFTVYGFDVLIRDYMPLSLDGFLHFHEKDSADRTCVMSIIGREYYKIDGWIYNPVYKSLFCDNEATEIARIRGKYHYIDTTIFEHQLPAMGHHKRDKMFDEQQEIGYREDQPIFNERKANNFYL